MTEKIDCPVPQKQRPEEEFKEFIQSWFFCWPSKGQIFFLQRLFISWVVIVPITLTILHSSLMIRQNQFLLALTTIASSLFLPIILCYRQWLGWKYIYHRLISDEIEYEETGWYDGQIWTKTKGCKEKDLMISQYEVKPIIDVVNQSIALIVVLTSVDLLIIILMILLY